MKSIQMFCKYCDKELIPGKLMDHGKCKPKENKERMGLSKPLREAYEKIDAQAELLAECLEVLKFVGPPISEAEELIAKLQAIAAKGGE